MPAYIIYRYKDHRWIELCLRPMKWKGVING